MEIFRQLLQVVKFLFLPFYIFPQVVHSFSLLDYLLDYIDEDWYQVNVPYDVHTNAS